MDFRARLRQAIDATGKEDKTIAADAGIAKETLSRILNGVNQDPGFETMKRLAAATNVTVGWLAGDEPFSLADGSQLAEIIDYLSAKLRPASARPEPNAVPVTGASGDQLLPPIPDEAMPAQATPGAEQDPNAVPAGPSGSAASDRHKQPYQAVGDSMIDAAIIEGDVLYLRKAHNRQDAEGEIIVCSVDGSIYVKRFFYRNRRPELRSENRIYGPMIIDPSQRFEIIGVVIRVVRDLSRKPHRN
ncbi:MAG: polymerase [Thermoanaerobaculia bacterium]|jgi:phage repressor protein C with HTH and peptisase S24 domain|nr:polymerase [Thermoanaerobaculia bacterium]